MLMCLQMFLKDGCGYSDVPQLHKRAALVSSRGKYDDANPLYLRAIAIGEKTRGTDHPDLATWLNNRAGC